MSIDPRLVSHADLAYHHPSALAPVHFDDYSASGTGSFTARLAGGDAKSYKKVGNPLTDSVIGEGDVERAIAKYEYLTTVAKTVKFVGKVLVSLGLIGTALFFGSPLVLTGLSILFFAGARAIAWMKNVPAIANPQPACSIANSSYTTANFVWQPAAIKIGAIVAGTVIGVGAILWTGGAFAEKWCQFKVTELRENFGHEDEIEEI